MCHNAAAISWRLVQSKTCHTFFYIPDFSFLLTGHSVIFWLQRLILELSSMVVHRFCFLSQPQYGSLAPRHSLVGKEKEIHWPEALKQVINIHNFLCNSCQVCQIYFRTKFDLQERFQNGQISRLMKSTISPQ